MIKNVRRINNIILVSIILFIAPILIFINVHLIHNYYQVSSTLFIIYALAIAVAFLTPRLMVNNLIVLAVTLIFVSSNLYYFNNGYANSMRASITTKNNTTLAVTDVIKRYTPQDSAIVVFGSMWTSEYAYYSERKAFTVPYWFNDYWKIWDDPASYLGGKNLGAIVFCGQQINDIVQQPNVEQQPVIFNIGCFIWMPDVKSIEVPGINHPILPMNFSDK